MSKNKQLTGDEILEKLYAIYVETRKDLNEKVMSYPKWVKEQKEWAAWKMKKGGK